MCKLVFNIFKNIVPSPKNFTLPTPPPPPPLKKKNPERSPSGLCFPIVGKVFQKKKNIFSCNLCLDPVSSQKRIVETSNDSQKAILSMREKIQHLLLLEY